MAGRGVGSTWVSRLAAFLIAIVVVPYALGVAYAAAMLPAYALLCDQVSADGIVADAGRPHDRDSYLGFLEGKGCNVPSPPPPACSTDDCSADNNILNGSIGEADDDYRGLHQWWRDNPLANPLGYVAQAFWRAMLIGADVAITLHASNSIVASLAMLVVMILSLALGAAVPYLTKRWLDRLLGLTPEA